MISPRNICDQINLLISHLIKIGLSEDQNYAFFRTLDNSHQEVTFKNAEHASIAIKNLCYADIYKTLADSRAFIVKLPDGAICHLRYLFHNNSLIKHTLAFFPSPFLEEYQNNPETYNEEALFADVVSRNIVPFPIRFDFDSNEDVVKDVFHPASHQTLGQYKNCRIPVSSPLTPNLFFEYILRHFYCTAFQEYCEALPKFSERFPSTISPSERLLIHIQIP
jgi:hypothetical protein